MDPVPKSIPKMVGITGPRDLSREGVAKVRSALKALVGNYSVDEIWFGGARGTDSIALQAALEFRVGRRPKLVVVVPNTVDEQPVETRQWTRRADSIIELKQEITDEDNFRAFHYRNEFICNHASVLVAFWNGNLKSGTGACIRYAEKTKLNVKKIPV